MEKEKNKERIPQLRFPEFKNAPAWKQRKVREIFTVTRGQVLSAMKVSEYKTADNIYPVYSSQTKNDGLMGYFNEYLFDTAITWTTDGANAGTVNFREGKFFSTNVNGVLLSNDGLANKAVSEIINKVAWKHVSKVGNPKLMNNVMSEIRIMIPTLAEQKAIGDFFQTLDRSIALHQRELENLKNRKKSLLQKMFPKNGESVPKIRFPEFKNAPAWEQRKSDKIFQSVSDKNHPDLPVLSASQELGMVKRDDVGIDIKYDKSSLKNYKRVVPGQFVIHLRSFQGGFAHSIIEGITSPAYTILDFVKLDEHSDLFWKNILTSRDFIKRLEAVTYGIRDGRSISFSDFSSLNFNFPTLPEQKAIGDFFSTLDHSIALHQRKLEHLKLRKKALLQKMVP
ncbi:restriction endonuclease subunit S [Streptococcus constellatus]|uniref:restriction endonuclease subunit S n=1 Tax=Streptococcus constellatus TaxID=76860 RepID=UPI0028E35C94|nr:restriction endonuclease subunit S [Streptococcus constellatus]